MEDKSPDIVSKPIIWILGGPGCGKGTQCELIQKRYGFEHISTGDLIRLEIDGGSDRGKCIADLVEKGKLIPNELMLNLLRSHMLKVAPAAKGFLIDGYPREANQGVAFENAIGPASAIIYFEASVDTILSRLRHRALNSQRSDDNEATMKLRIETFLENNNKVLDMYKDRCNTINAERDPNSIFAEVVSIIDPIVAQFAQAQQVRDAARTAN